MSEEAADHTAVVQHRLDDDDFPDDWDVVDIETLAGFLAEYDLGELTAVVDPDADGDFVLTVPKEDDEDTSRSIPPAFQTEPVGDLTTGAGGLDTGPEITQDDMERIRHEPCDSGVRRKGGRDV